MEARLGQHQSHIGIWFFLENNGSFTYWHWKWNWSLRYPVPQSCVFAAASLPWNKQIYRIHGRNVSETIGMTGKLRGLQWKYYILSFISDRLLTRLQRSSALVRKAQVETEYIYSALVKQYCPDIIYIHVFVCRLIRCLQILLICELLT